MEKGIHCGDHCEKVTEAHPSGVSALGDDQFMFRRWKWGLFYRRISYQGTPFSLLYSMSEFSLQIC